MTAQIYEAWGRQRANPTEVVQPCLSESAQPPESYWLAHGMGRSYGDSCLVSDGALVDTRLLNKFLSFDRKTGVLKAESGVILADVLDLCVPEGWFIPVLPGTCQVTLGGAVANDIHGKNHHVAGTFGAHVRAFELVRSDGTRRLCSRHDNADWFGATIGGMGLTGLITWVEIQLVRIETPWIMQEALPLANLDDFFRLARESDADFAYSVAWIDSLATAGNLGRGVFFRGNHALKQDAGGQGRPKAAKPLTFPVDPPIPLINTLTLTLFNWAYRLSALRGGPRKLVHYHSFFFPLDKVAKWNRAYGRQGLRQFQCVLPMETARISVEKLLETARLAGHASFLTVLKVYGDQPSPGWLSFPRKGATLTLDFPYRGARTDLLLSELDAITLGAGGAVNPYKDARMPAEVFRASFPNWKRMIPFLDPFARSGLSRRVGLNTGDTLQDVK